MTRSELIHRLSKRFPQLAHVDAELAVKTILDVMSSQLEQHGRIEIRGFGSFSVHMRPPRKGRNPKTGVSVAVPAKAAPHFKAGVELKARVNQPPHPDQKLAA